MPEGSILRGGEGQAYWTLGDLYTIKATGAETGNAFALVEILARPNNGPPPHIHHREQESFYVLDGEFSFPYQEKTLSCGAGSFVHIPRGTLHTFNNVGPEAGRLLVLVSPAGLEQFFVEMGEPAAQRTLPPTAGPPDLDKLMRLAQKYHIEIRMA